MVQHWDTVTGRASVAQRLYLRSTQKRIHSGKPHGHEASRRRWTRPSSVPPCPAARFLSGWEHGSRGIWAWFSFVCLSLPLILISLAPLCPFQPWALQEKMNSVYKLGKASSALCRLLQRAPCGLRRADVRSIHTSPRWESPTGPLVSGLTITTFTPGKIYGCKHKNDQA